METLDQGQDVVRLRPARWWLDAACADTDIDFFSSSIRERARAVRLCGTCPVRVPCADEGRDEVIGVWGGVVRG